ncbi:MAG: hypothetical protein JSR82_24675 [Verrucomicrobia bacterium]|nr:hypothetical protein [Verrucomicrobiota bacterium]
MPFVPPADYPRLRVVGSFAELLQTPFADGVNALCWPRELTGDFAEVVRHLPPGTGIQTLDEDTLLALPLSAAGREAVDTLGGDLALLREAGLDPVLDAVFPHERELPPGPVPTDVYSWHADSATVEADTWLCTYHGASSELLRQEDAIRRVDVPATRAELRQIFGGPEGPEFGEFLQERCYDLHYVARPGAKPVVFGHGNLWRIAVEHPDRLVTPCVHRAPLTPPGAATRLLLLS